MRRFISAIAIALLCFSVEAFAQQPVAPSPSAQPAPTLERINLETQALYETVRPGLVRVQLPVPKWMTQLADRDNPINKWKLDPEVRAKLEEQVTAGQVQAHITPSTQPGGAAEPTTQPDSARWQLMMVQRPDGEIEYVLPSAAPLDSVIGAIVAPRSLGIVYDDLGHIVIPVYMDKESFDEKHPLTVFAMTEGASTAKFVGSDRQTNLTVLKLEHPLGQRAAFAGKKPVDGSLVMMLAQGGEEGRLAVWTRNQQDRGLVVDMRGRVSGFARLGQFLDAELAKPVIDQLIQYGSVRRASLGVLVTEAEAPDGRRAMHVDQVKPDSPAQAAGLKEGDFILAISGNPVDDLPNFAAAISSSNGSTAMQILRGAETLNVQVELRPK